MNITVAPRRFDETVRIPASKSHTIRRLLVASFAEGVSKIDYPLDSLDARSCLSICRALGARIWETKDSKGGLERWTVRGTGGAKGLKRRTDLDVSPILDVGNSGTSLFLALAMASLGDEPFTFTGDEQIARRSAAPLLEALAGLGVDVRSGKNGCIPVTARGPWRGGRVSVECPTSQYLSALLLAAPLAPAGTLTEIDVPLLNEKPYIGMTLSYLDRQDIAYKKKDDFSYFAIRGGSAYVPINGAVSADFSSAAFPACAAAVSRGKTVLLGLDPNDSQGDKAFFDMLGKMGCDVKWEPSADGGMKVTVEGGTRLRGGRFDLNDTPDMLPAAAVLAAFADGETRLENVAHARIKETDRIAAMAAELGKLGVDCTELPDGLVIRGGKIPSGGLADGHGDHRIVMALAVCGLGAAAPITVTTTEAADITYPGFLSLLEIN
ncbi:MAG: 3-phosphoshikimate 1-carboxyvinyltransferase [Spirochaetaceae bacterium]|jgi:3-phosphoshikimate 1-carboxyvinyltransferase|nr:3-phosphoshikimate 1-carboxyvinyltransferase [Spirochaetaceae bacterium]